jgi:choline dehydrogenase-like flavoprotein
VIYDLEDIGPRNTWSADICVVGAGAAGITIAREFIGSGLRVCLVESGGLAEESDTQALYRGENVGHSVVMDEGRYRVFGGSTNRWAGRCAMFDPIDFEPRDWVDMSGWPIDLATLSSYYDRAMVVARFAEPWIPDDEVPAALGLEISGFSTTGLRPFIWRYAPSGFRNYPSWAKMYGEQLRADPNTHIFLHANLTGFTATADGSTIQSIIATSLNHVSISIEAKAFVLCCGGIENVRLLLNAPENVVRKVNVFDNLGRYFAQHPRGRTATLLPTAKAARRLQNLFGVFTKKSGVQYEFGFALSEDAQREHRLLNASATIYYEARPESSWSAGVRLVAALRSRKPYRGIFYDMAKATRELRNLARRAFRSQSAILSDPVVSVVIDLEQQPDFHSRVCLSDQIDPLGLKRAKLNWRISELERTTARHLNNLVVEELKKLGFGQIEAAAWLTGTAPIRDDELYGTYHHIGTTRMSKDPRDGVVNEDCRAHGVDNLYLAGCSVFPTGGHANPTLTIVALAIRMADHLRNRFANEASRLG